MLYKKYRLGIWLKAHIGAVYEYLAGPAPKTKTLLVLGVARRIG